MKYLAYYFCYFCEGVS